MKPSVNSNKLFKLLQTSNDQQCKLNQFVSSSSKRKRITSLFGNITNALKFDTDFLFFFFEL